MTTDEIISNLKAGTIKQIETRLDTLLNICESPIEKLFLIQAFNYFNSAFVIYTPPNYLFEEIDNNQLQCANYFDEITSSYYFIRGFSVNSGNEFFQIIPQFQVICNNFTYRIDIAIMQEITFIAGKRKGEKTFKKFAIECDGYKYHSNTQQLTNDNKRTRLLLEQGWTVLRYSGSEIFSLGSSQSFSNVLSTMDKIIINST